METAVRFRILTDVRSMIKVFPLEKARKSYKKWWRQNPLPDCTAYGIISCPIVMDIEKGTILRLDRAFLYQLKYGGLQHGYLSKFCTCKNFDCPLSPFSELSSATQQSAHTTILDGSRSAKYHLTIWYPKHPDYIIPYIGNRRIKTITARMLEQFCRELQTKPAIKIKRR